MENAKLQLADNFLTGPSLCGDFRTDFPIPFFAESFYKSYFPEVLDNLLLGNFKRRDVIITNNMDLRSQYVKFKKIVTVTSSTSLKYFASKQFCVYNCIRFQRFIVIIR
jgi:hypothetical protein